MLTLSYINTTLSQSAFRIYKCYIIILNEVVALKVVRVPEAFQMLEVVVESPAVELSSPIVTMGKREDVYDEPPRKKTTYRNLPSGKKDPMCGICLSGPEKNKKGKLFHL